MHCMKLIKLRERQVGYLLEIALPVIGIRCDWQVY